MSKGPIFEPSEEARWSWDNDKPGPLHHHPAGLTWVISMDPDPITARSIADDAVTLVSGERSETHGDVVKNHTAIADMWNGYLKARVGIKEAELDAEDVANMMECLKIARRLNGSFNKDDYVDGAGYAAVAGEIRSRLSDKP
jgi:hypothetical protein